jgi:hypothetical protein
VSPTIDVPQGTEEARCLVRATDGKKIQYSTLVQAFPTSTSTSPCSCADLQHALQVSAKDVVKFQIHLATLFKANFAALKKKEKHRGPARKKAAPAAPAAAAAASGSPAPMES